MAEKAQSIPRVRVEIICSQALEEDFAEEFDKAGVGKRYTKLAGVMGAGYSNPHLGDAIWPQLNTMYIIYCDEKEAATIQQIVLKLRQLFITEGIGCFIASGTEI